MKSFINKNIWIYSAIIYPLSWVTYSAPNFSFLAWFAFVPLFIYLSRQTESFKKFYGSALLVTMCWAFTTSLWLFNFPTTKWQIFLTFFIEILHISVPFIILYFIQKKIGFNKALLIFPFMWVVWEWLYIPMEHTLGTLPLPYSQGNNIWLIQMADLGGMWLVSFWVMLFNVALFFAVQSHNFQILSMPFAKKASMVSTLMILPALLYFAYSFEHWSGESNETLQISIVPTQYNPQELMSNQNQKTIIEQTLHRTDSLAYDLMAENRGSDLYVWPEAGTSYWMAFDNITSILHEATTDWSGSLLTGCKGIPVEGNDRSLYVSAVMVSPGSDDLAKPLQYHHKTMLVPGSETMPYKEFIMPLIDKAYSEKKYFTEGTSQEPLQLETKDKRIFKPGISLCYEQWFPSVWTEQANNGAEFFVHMAAEGWYGDRGHAQYMANVSRFRAVETRRSVVRSSNKGLSMFFNPLGQTHNGIAYGSLNMATSNVTVSKEMTLYSQYPGAFPFLCIGISVFLGLFFTIRLPQQVNQKVAWACR